MSLAALGLTEAHEKLYLQALGAPGAARVTSLAPQHPDDARLVDDLRELGLLGGADGCVVQPPSVLADLAERVADELAARQRAVARTHADIAELARVVAHRDALGDTSGASASGSGIEFVADGAAVRERIDELSFFARHSIVSVQPVSTRPAGPSPATGRTREDERALRRGLDVRVVVDRAVSPVPGTRIRVVDAVLHRVIVIDDEVAVVAAGGGGAVIVRQPGVLELVRAYVTLLWTSAGAAASRSQPSDSDRELLQLLVDGATDESMARALGLSSRQARRRIARLMTTLDASNRFAAGVEAARRGWL